MSNSRNDYHRNKFRDYDDDYSARNESRERNQHRKQKRLNNALRSLDVDTLYDLDED